MPLLIQTPTGPQVASEEEKAELLALLGPLPVGPQGLQGERGERGLSGADAPTQVTFANNLTTSDPTVGLAAPQGVALKAQIDSLAQTTSTGLQAAAAATTAAQAAAIAASAPVEHTHTLLITQAERDKLGTVAANATQNATDVALRDRTTHAGQQPISTVLGLQASLDNKADLIGGKLNPAQVPDIAIQQYLGSVANQAAMLALVGQSGDWCSRSDTGTVLIITGSPAVIGGWTQLSYPASAVQSVCGLVGVITVAQLGAALASLFASPAQGAKADSALQDIDGINTVLAGAAQAKLAVTQSLVSGGAPTVYRVTTPYRMIGTSTARQEFGRINIPQDKLPAGAYIKGWVQFAGTRNAASKTHIIGVNDAGGGLYGCVDIFNAALTTSNYAGNRVEFWLRIQNTDCVEAGLYGSSSGLGPVSSSSAAVNPVTAEINLRGGGLDIAFGGNLAAPVTGTVSISQAAPGVVSWTAHGCVAGQPVSFSAPPAPLVANRIYYVVSGATLLTDSFTVSEIRGGPEITTTAAAASITGTAYTEFGIVDAHVEVTA